MDAIYLDHNATTPPAPEVVEAMTRALRDAWGNPSSPYPAGRRAKAAIERAAEQVAALIGARPDEIVFTSGGTESNDLALGGVAALAAPGRRRIVRSAVEHPSVTSACEALGGAGFEIEALPVGADGRIDPPAGFDASVALVTVMLANNETGAIQPIEAVAAAARAAGATVHTDAAQAVGKIPVDVQRLGVDLLTIAGHKLYGPKGIGALYVRRGTALAPRLRGGGQQRGLRPGTEPVPAIVGLGAACALADDRGRESARQASLRRTLAERLRSRVPGLAVTVPRDLCLPNTLHVRFPRTSGAAVLAGAPEVSASTGSACHAGSASPSGVLLAMGIAPDDALGAVRLSVGRSTTEADVLRAADALARSWSEANGHR